MKLQITIIFNLICTIATLGQSSAEGIEGTYKSNGNQFERYSIMILEPNNRFTYKYALSGCQGEVRGDWRIVDKVIKFENDLIYLNDSVIHYPNLALCPWRINRFGIKPEQVVNSGCLKEDNLHFKAGVISSRDFYVSIFSLITLPEKYHEKKVQVAGYLNLEFEGDAIYLHKEDYEKHLTKNGIWVTFSDKLSKTAISKLNKEYVLLEGVFTSESQGHMGMYSGEIYEITRIIKWGN